MGNRLIDTLTDYLTLGKDMFGVTAINTTLGVLILRQLYQLNKEFREARGVFSKGNFTSNYVIADNTAIEPIIDKETGKQRVTNDKPDFLLKLSTTKDNVPSSQIFRGDFQREAMRFVNRARKKATTTKPIFELLRRPGVITKFDEIRLRTTRHQIIENIEHSWTRYLAERSKRTHDFNQAGQDEVSERIASVSVLVAEPDGHNNQLRIFDMAAWQLQPKNIPTVRTANVWVHNSLVDLFPNDDNYQHTPPDVEHHQRIRLRSLRSVGKSLMSDPERLLKRNVVSAETGKVRKVELAPNP